MKALVLTWLSSTVRPRVASLWVSLPQQTQETGVAMRNDSMSKGAVMAAVLCLAGAMACEARTASVDEVRADSRPPASPVDAAGPWWTAFNEAPLAGLQRAAAARSQSAPALSSGSSSMPLDAQVTAAYVGLRTFHLRWRLALEMRDSLELQRRMLASAPPTASLGEALKTIDQRRATCDRLVAAMQSQRDASMNALAALTGKSAQDLFGELHDALDNRDLPAFNAPTPERLPRSVLLARSDVSASRSLIALGPRSSPEAQRQLAIGPANLTGWIAAAPGNVASVPGSDLPDVQNLLTVSAQAESEVSADLSALQQRTVRTARLVEVVKSRQLELEAVKRRQQVGAASAHDVILGTQTLLVDDDELAASAGELAYAWIRLQASTGGQALQARGQPDE
jgi:hypothetical protein